MVRLASIQHNGKTKLVAQLAKGYCDLSSVAANARSFLELGDDAIAKAKALMEQATGDESPLYIPTEAAALLAPIDGSLVGKFLCIGMNYVDHCTEQNLPIPKEPLVFSKFGSCIVGTGVPVVKDTQVEKLDYEVELGIVIGSTVPRNVSKEEAPKYIGGYTVVHDVSARDWQLEQNGGQWLLGKAIDGYAPIGPVIVTSEEMTMEGALGWNPMSRQRRSVTGVEHRSVGLWRRRNCLVGLAFHDSISRGCDCYGYSPRRRVLPKSSALVGAW